MYKFNEYYYKLIKISNFHHLIYKSSLLYLKNTLKIFQNKKLKIHIKFIFNYQY